MRSNFGRIVLGIAAVAVAVVLLIVLRDDGGDEEHLPMPQPAGKQREDREAARDRAAQPAEPPIPTIVVRNGKPVGGVEEITVEAGERVRFRVRSNTTDEVHVHGYDIEREVGPGASAEFDFPATIEGLFEAELHGSGEQIAELRIEP
jgi:hypothetical protein